MAYELADAGWLAYAHGILTERAATHPAQTFSMCEKYTNAPAHIANAGDDVAWSCVVAGGEVDFGPGERRDVGVYIEGDYQSCLPLARYDTRDDPVRIQEFQRMIAEALDTGILKRVAREGGAGTMKHIHDMLAKVTR